MIRQAALCVALLAAPVLAQESGSSLPEIGEIANVPQPDIAAGSIRAENGAGAVLKGLDKVSGDVSDLELAVGETATVGRLELTLGECRYPEDNPTGEAYAWLTIHDTLRDADVFSGWMIASSPALNALDHARFDVWVIRCTTA